MQETARRQEMQTAQRQRLSEMRAANQLREQQLAVAELKRSELQVQGGQPLCSLAPGHTVHMCRPCCGGIQGQWPHTHTCWGLETDTYAGLLNFWSLDYSTS